MPLFVAPEGLRNDALPGMSRYSVAELAREVEELVRLGVNAVILFGIPEEKDDEGSGAWIEDGIVQQALRELRPRFPELLLLTDVCVREALRECELDLAEGADVLMIKPALPYLDVIRAVRDRVDAPIAAYNVSGEYAMIKDAARAGHIDERLAALESLTAIKRAGADLVFSYWTKELAGWL